MDPAPNSRRGQPRELSPWSARRALTEQMNRGTGGAAVPSPAPTHSEERPRAAKKENGARQGAEARSSPPPPRGRWDTTRSPPPPPKSREPERSAPPERTRERKSKEASVEVAPKARDRDASPEPYRRSREESRERKRDRSRDRRRDGSKDKRHDRSTDRRWDRSKEPRRDRSRDKDRRRDRSRDRDREKDRKRDRSRDKERERTRDRSKERRRHRSRSGDRERDRRRDRSKDRRTRSPIPYRSKRRTRSPSRSASPPPKRSKRTRSPSRSPVPRSKKPLPSQEISFRGTNNSELAPTKYGGAPANLEKPNFKPTGLLAKAANKVEGTKISLKYHEPAEARKPPPSQQWRIFVFKGPDVVDNIELHTRSCWLLGRSREVVDYVLEHPSSSGQHAVIQFRYIQKTVEDEYGVKKQKGKVKPYIIDLESSNGTELNGDRIEASRYFELRDKDILQFAGSEREYVVMLPPPGDK
ncbi:hypothetical protein K458DRAFT_422509 [Lentithecium fluviatile CBS 122367]|uniref:FHA domain-containing protein n=1 Tax=Lentithecium fluviatile CBS 122367 TaxID=1168545 RepID=A0A6G1IM65_9PLEO|nr:hypothetical protein K458DRAFT_422509 [Lentithecium fluviatile CBS 122367]